MEIIEVNQEVYSKIISKPYHVFGAGEFTLLNRDKAESVHYLLFKDKKYRFGITGGSKENSFLSPFSAPFGGLMYTNKDIKISLIDEALQTLYSWAKTNNLKSLQFVLPPNIYHESFLAKQSNSLLRNGFSLDNLDLNYSYSTDNFNDLYSKSIWRNARKNLRIALSNELSFCTCENSHEKRIAYEVIKKNRLAKGFPLRMTWQQMLETIRLIHADFFLCHDKTGNPIAAAIVFHTAKDIVQVIYWGDLLEFSHLKTMNYLGYKVFEHYKSHDIKIIDIGPSTEKSVPNHGLCEFKESIGCDITQKLIFKREIL